MDRSHSSEKISLSIKSQDGNVMFFQVSRDAPLMKLLRGYCKKRQLEYKTMRFLYDGQRIPEGQTAAQHRMTDGDEVDALTEQSGGASGDSES